MDTANLKKHGWSWQKVDQNRIEAYDPNGDQRCGAKTSSSDDGHPCRKRPVDGRERCATHGGTQTRGPAHHKFVDGRYSRHMPTRLARRVQDVLGDPDLLSLRDNLALLDVRLGELSERIDPGTFGAGYTTLHERYTEARDLLQRGMTGDRNALTEFVRVFEDIGRLIRAGKDDYQVWSEIIELNDKRRVMTKTIEDIRHKGERAVAADQLAVVLSRLAAAFERANAYDDPRQRAKTFDREIVQIMDYQDTGT